jgi:molybdopterin-guanine dinucleotide biosynthesis protein A
MIERDDITGVVLCGGAGRRMGGRDKPLVELAGQPLVAHVVARLAPQVVRVVISCGRNAERYAHWGDTIVVDDIAGQGPLRGLLMALLATDTPYAFVCPGDAPLLSASLVRVLARARTDDAIDACVPHDGQRPQHLFLLLRSALRGDLRKYLEGGGRSVRGWVETLRTRTVDVSTERDAFMNVNSDDDLASLNATLAGSTRTDSP